MSANDAVPMTEEGMARIKMEMAELERKRPQIKRAIEEAREKGDLRENADYHASREELAMLNARIAQLNGMLANAVIIDTSRAPKDKVVLGCTVTFTRQGDGKTLVRTIVGAGQADPASGRILVTSPLAKAMVGHGPGETVTADLPGGSQNIHIDKIEFV
ncbi:MAG: transcription elongation factor GreA [Planctomycetota bacterium]|jgi:transcription elongation factor GreA|nr:transcription elongation factor GreA [Planctomycetota bacterium]